DVILAQVALRQQETSLKQQLVRELDPAIEAAPIVPLDTIEVPERDDIPPLRALIGRAMENRPDVAINRLQDESAAISAIGTQNGLLPTLIPFGYIRDRSTAGTPQPASGTPTNPYFVGGYGTAFGQIFRRDFPSEQAGIYLTIPLNNRQAQAD